MSLKCFVKIIECPSNDTVIKLSYVDLDEAMKKMIEISKAKDSRKPVEKLVDWLLDVDDTIVNAFNKKNGKPK